MMQPLTRFQRVLTITGIFYIVIGIALACACVWLAALGGTLFYSICGIGILITGALLIASSRLALWVYSAVLVGTFAWLVAEIGFDWWPLASRVDVIFLLGLWL